MVLELSEVGVARSRTTVLNDVTLELSHPVTTTMGPNGAGKTTLLQAVAGLLRYSGTIRFDGKELKFPAALSMLGYAPQTITWPARLQVREVCELAAHLRRVPVNQRLAAVDRALHLAGLSDISRHQVRRLSGGQRRRLTLAQALVHSPALLLLDEPTSELDPMFSEAFASTIAQLSEEMQILVTTHSLDDVGRWPGEVVVIAQGRAMMVEQASQMSVHRRIEAVRGKFQEVSSHAN